jgi:hypothetical protein
MTDKEYVLSEYPNATCNLNHMGTRYGIWDTFGYFGDHAHYKTEEIAWTVAAEWTRNRTIAQLAAHEKLKMYALRTFSEWNKIENDTWKKQREKNRIREEKENVAKLKSCQK